MSSFIPMHSFISDYICCYFTSWTSLLERRIKDFETVAKKISKTPKKNSIYSKAVREVDRIRDKGRLKWLRLHVFQTQTVPLRWMLKFLVLIICIGGIQRAGLVLWLHSFYWVAFLHVRFIFNPYWQISGKFRMDEFSSKTVFVTPKNWKKTHDF